MKLNKNNQKRRGKTEMNKQTQKLLGIAIVMFILGMLMASWIIYETKIKDIEQDIVNGCFVIEKDEPCYINVCKDNKWICIDENGRDK